ncbi:MAG: galactose oxidase, partial [Candidatus Dadabacteria bacterium]|nr:galactose oxidase [Candidatus Dadabacteria bacterium]NIT14745.1 galactose oxidase [Candidatus Dadabacteria bacterium]
NGNYGINLAVNEVFSPKENRWMRQAPLITYRSGIAGVTLKDKIYVFGGESNKKTFNENERFDPKTN